MILDLLVPLLLFFLSAFSLSKKQDVYAIMTEGMQNGFRLLLTIAPSVMLLLCAVKMLRASGFFEILCAALSPVFGAIGFPVELLPLMLIRPISGSAALAVAAEIMKTYGVDSAIGQTAAIMLGSTETTFYTISVYFGATGLKRTRYAVPAALCADLAGFIGAVLAQKLFFGVN